MQKTKKCSKCKETKPSEDFHVRNKIKNYLASKCKKCISEQQKETYQKNIEQERLKARLKFKEKYQNDSEFKEKHKESSKKYRQEHKEEKKIKDKQYRQKPEVKNRINEDRRKKYSENGLSEKKKEYLKQYMKEYNKKYIKTPKGEAANAKYRKSQKHKDYRKKQYEKIKNKPEYKINQYMSKGLWKALKNKKQGSWKNLVSFSIEELKTHLENLFLPGMTWDNYGEWHIDHIKPRSTFNIVSKTCSDLKECWSLSNLQPLWAKDNLKKSNKY